MRAIILFSGLMLAAGGAQACVARDAATAPHGMRSDQVQLGGSVVPQERPLPGSVLRYPGMFTPVRGPHGGLLAQQQPVPNGQG